MRDASIGPYTACSSNGVTLRERARTIPLHFVIDAATHVGRSALIEGAIVTAPATSATMSGSRRAPPSATR